MKTEFDIGGRVFVYNLGGVGYDVVRKIDLQYEVGSGAGYHLFTRTIFAMNVESGFDYRVQERAGSPGLKSFLCFRLTEGFTWRITLRVVLVGKAELFPRVESPDEFRARLGAVLSSASGKISH